MGEEAASGKEKMEETRQLMVLVPAQARTINSNTVFNVFSVTHQHKQPLSRKWAAPATATILRHNLVTRYSDPVNSEMFSVIS